MKLEQKFDNIEYFKDYPVAEAKHCIRDVYTLSKYGILV